MRFKTISKLPDDSGGNPERLLNCHCNSPVYTDTSTIKTLNFLVSYTLRLPFLIFS